MRDAARRAWWVLGAALATAASAVPAAAQRLARGYAEQTRALGLPPEQALALVRAALDLPS